MMQVLTIIALSLFAGFVASGSVWVIWSVAENLLARRASAKPGGAETKGESHEDESAPTRGKAPGGG